MRVLVALVSIAFVLITWCSGADTNQTDSSVRVHKCSSYSTGAQQSLETDLNFALEYPHVAQIAYYTNNTTVWRCQGSLLSSRFILTAAQCLTNGFIGPPTKVKLGVLVPQPSEYDVEKFSVHPNYSNRTIYNDIGLIKLAESVTFSEYIRPICLPAEDHLANITYRLNYRFHGNNVNSIPPIERHKLRLIENDVCTKYYRTILSVAKVRDGLHDTQICYREIAYTNGACSGYSGSPLLIAHPDVKNANIQIGITFFGRRCNYQNPEGYTKVYSYAQWIENIVWPDGQAK